MITYKDSGVDIDAGNESVQRIKKHVRSTFDEHVVNDIGSFGSMYDIKDFIQTETAPLLVQSTDSVGTKTMIARMMNKYDIVGRDIVGHCSNDIIVQGARPITFLDYIAVEHVYPQMIEDIVRGMSIACKEAQIVLVGGEVAELPGVYREGEFDLVGTITGIVEKGKIITGESISDGDVVLGFSSNGLHTNGYSLARKVLFDHAKYTVHSHVDELGGTVGDALLKPHTNYTVPILSLINAGVHIRGLAHITGGGFIENIPRVLPEDCSVEIKKGTWAELPIFSLIKRLGEIEESEMYRTFNMGIGMVMIISESEIDTALQVMSIVNKYKQFELYEIGRVVRGEQEVTLA